MAKEILTKDDPVVDDTSSPDLVADWIQDIYRSSVAGGSSGAHPVVRKRL